MLAGAPSLGGKHSGKGKGGGGAGAGGMEAAEPDGASWTWQYKHHYGPLISDLVGGCTRKAVKLTTPDRKVMWASSSCVPPACPQRPPASAAHVPSAHGLTSPGPPSLLAGRPQMGKPPPQVGKLPLLTLTLILTLTSVPPSSRPPACSHISTCLPSSLPLVTQAGPQMVSYRASASRHAALL